MFYEKETVVGGCECVKKLFGYISWVVLKFEPTWLDLMTRTVTWFI